MGLDIGGAVAAASREAKRQGLGRDPGKGSGAQDPRATDRQAQAMAGVANANAPVTSVQGRASTSGQGKIVSETNPLSANPNNPQTQNALRSASNYAGLGATPYVEDPSLGQIVGALLSAVPFAGTINNGLGLAHDLMDGGASFGRVYDGGAVGQALDATRGVTPGKVTGSSNPDLGGNQTTRGAKRVPVASYGRIEDADAPASLADTLTQVLSAPGTWPPVRASKGI